jgi:hypothetical protein
MSFCTYSLKIVVFITGDIHTECVGISNITFLFPVVYEVLQTNIKLNTELK